MSAQVSLAVLCSCGQRGTSTISEGLHDDRYVVFNKRPTLSLYISLTLTCILCGRQVRVMDRYSRVVEPSPLKSTGETMY